MSDQAPVCLFVYNRPWHTVQTVEALKRNEGATDTDLIIFSDFARNSQAVNQVIKVRNYLKTITGFKQVIIRLRDENFGLSRNIINGVTEVLNDYGKVIVLEDDLVTSPFFLRYMNAGLSIYNNDIEVASIHGYVVPNQGLPETFFLRGADCWGWATWSRAWNDFETDGKILLKQIQQQNLAKEIDFNNSMGFVKMLKNQIEGKNDSWAVRWHISNFLRGRITLYPGVSFVRNIGFDNSGVHSVVTNRFESDLCAVLKIPERIDLIESEIGRNEYEAYFRRTANSLSAKIIARLKKEFSVVLKRINKEKLKSVVIGLTPPILKTFLASRFKNRWKGDYSNWKEAQDQTTGYQQQAILDKVYEAVSKVKHGVELYERDSVVFDERQYSWPMLVGLLYAASKSEGRIHVLDFGGSLGSSYFQNKVILDQFKDVSWSVVEQLHFVEKGKEFIQDDTLRFYETVAECVKNETPNIILLSSVLQYLEDPFVFVDQLINQTTAEFVIVDRTPCHTGNGDDRITVQHVDPEIYNASYPCRIFNFDKLNARFESYGLTTIETFDAIDGTRGDIIFKGMIYQRKK